MASIHPFRALRPAPAAAAVRLLRSLRRRQHRRSASACGRQSAQFPARHAVRDRSPAGRRSLFAARCTTRPAQNLAALRASAPLVVDDAPALYFYRLRMGEHEQTGVAGCFSIDEYDRDIIKKHERTRRDKEDDRTRHMIALRAQTGVVFLTYRADADVDRSAADRHGRRAAVRLHRRRRRAPHRSGGPARGDQRAGGRLRADSVAVYCGRASSRGERGAGARRELGAPANGAARTRARSSPWRFPTTRSRSCRTTAP